MANQKPQTFENHTRQVPVFAIGILILLVHLCGRLYSFRYGISFALVMGVLVDAALIALSITARTSVVTVQDRLVRLEMRLRLAGLLPADMCARIPEFSVAQLVSMRFASDAELPGLARKVLEEKLQDRKAIKRLVKDWQADYLRA